MTNPSRALIEGPGGLFRVIVELGRQGPQRTKSGEDERSNTGIGADHDHDIGRSVTNTVERLPSAWALEEQAVEMVRLGPLAP